MVRLNLSAAEAATGGALPFVEGSTVLYTRPDAEPNGYIDIPPGAPHLSLWPLADGRRVLNAFAYTGGFGIAAGLGGAKEVVSVDTSGPALALARAAWERNGLPAERGLFVEADVFEFLRAEREPFDLIVDNLEEAHANFHDAFCCESTGRHHWYGADRARKRCLCPNRAAIVGPRRLKY